MAEPITSFSGKWHFLSNFYPSYIKLDDKTYDSVEHAYQAAKTEDEEDRNRIRNAPSPGEAKRLGRRVTIRPDWNEVKVDVMLALLRQKFSKSVYKGWLLSTGDAEPVEGNTWGDTFWGVCNGIGENWLGRLIMQVRKESR